MHLSLAVVMHMERPRYMLLLPPVQVPQLVRYFATELMQHSKISEKGRHVMWQLNERS
jgi:hypothetical protein|tara:strand:- start:380 stop:553 length:174 start_codon:yes stop_codon:yes gene_type:complete